MFLKAMTTAAALAAAPLAAQAEELKIADFQPPTHFVVPNVYEPFNAALSEATGGELTAKAFMGGELGAGPVEQYNRAVDGVADIVLSLPGYTASNFQTTLLTELPGVIQADTGTEAIQDNLDFLAQEYRRVALVALWNNAPNLLMMANDPVRSLEDLKGLSLRVPSRNAGLVVEAWGATPVSMPATEIYNAMQTGVIDGAMIDATSLTAFRLAEVTNYITQGMDTTISSFFLIMNRDSFADLSDEEQQIVRDAGRQASFNGQKAWADVAAAAMEQFAATEGKEIITLDADAAAAFNAASAPVVEKVIADADAEGLPASGYVAALKGE